MKISANLNNLSNRILDILPFGVMVLDKENHINRMNKFMRNLLDSHTVKHSTADIKKILGNPMLEEVKQTHQPKEKKDYLLHNKIEVIVFYHPLLTEQGTLEGVLVVIELFSDFSQRTNRYTDYEIYQHIFSMVKEEKSNIYRVMTDQEKIWFETDAWQEEFSSFNEDIIKKVKQITKQTMIDRREIREKFLVERVNIHATIELISKPLLIKGKIVGCLQFLYVKMEEYYQNEIKQMRRLVRSIEKTYELEDLIGKGPEMKLALKQAALYKEMKAPILIMGEAGTGKTTLARAIHRESARRNRPFITLHSKTLKEKKTMEEAISFISKKALNGTAFVRIESSMSIHIQKNLLHLVHVCKSTRFIFGVISSPEGKGWDDQLNRMLLRYQIILPPLRERTEDIPFLIAELVYYFNQKYHKNISKTEDAVIEYWQNQEWPNNLTQLERELETIISSCDAFTEVISIDELSDKQKTESEFFISNKQVSLQQALKQFEQRYIYEALQNNHHNKTKTAEALNISVRNLYYKMEKYHMDRGGT